MFNINNKCQRLLANEMCIDLKHLKEKIESPEISIHASLICEVIETLCSYVGEKTDDDVNSYSYSVIKNMDSEPDFTIDAIRMAFVRFISGGLKDLFVYQENEAWYPKIILNKILKPNDIESLDEEFTIFRGCDTSELESNQFGQSWTTSENIAKDFAYNHYESQDWFEAEKRILVRAKYKKIDTLYSDQSEYGEYEIVINPEKISDIEKIT